MNRTENWYQARIPYTALGNGRKTKTEIVVIGFDDMIMATTNCNEKQYSKLFRTKQYKSKNAEDTLQYDMQKVLDKLTSWVKPEMNGLDLYKHDLKTNRMMDGMPLEGWFEMKLEAFMYKEVTK